MLFGSQAGSSTNKVGGAGNAEVQSTEFIAGEARNARVQDTFI